MSWCQCRIDGSPRLKDPLSLSVYQDKLRKDVACEVNKNGKRKYKTN